MDYMELAGQLLQRFHKLYKIRPQKQINASMHGEPLIFQYIAMHDGYVIPSELSNEMNISSARIATVLNSLENKGWITRQIDQNDRRRTILRLTPEGEEQAEKHKQKLLASTAKMLEYLGENDAKEYIRIAGRLAEMALNCDE